MEIAKVGDIIEWTFSNNKCRIGSFFEAYKGEIFQAEVKYVDINEDIFSDYIYYVVYTKYGYDLISHNQCKIIKRKEDDKT